MTTTHAHRPPASPAETAARTRKAHRIGEVLRAHGATAEEAAALPAEGRALAAELAGVRVASDATWACVVTLLHLHEMHEAGR